MTRKNQAITLSVKEQDKKALETLALEFGKVWGDKPNISKLVEAIARQELRIAPNHDWSLSRIKALNSARQILSDLGKDNEAREIAQLLCDRSELTLPFRTEIESFLNTPHPLWRQKLDNFMQRQQPFHLSYRDAADRLWEYTVLHAQIILLEKRQYLVCCCEESEGNQDVKELRHNWTLRLDRIQEAAVIPINFPWQTDLDRIAVEFRLSGGLAFAYERKPEDDFVGEIEGNPPVRQVIRNIYSTFWFFREIAHYWEDCLIISPVSIRDRLNKKIKLMHQQTE